MGVLYQERMNICLESLMYTQSEMKKHNWRMPITANCNVFLIPRLFGGLIVDPDHTFEGGKLCRAFRLIEYKTYYISVFRTRCVHL